MPNSRSVSTHLDMYAAVALDPIGQILGVESFRADPHGYQALIVWSERLGR
jgi:transposase